MIKEINSVNFIYKGKIEIDDSTKNKIHRYWEELKKEKNFLHEAKILVVSNFASALGNYTIELKETSFSNFMYAKEYGDIRALFSGAYILTLDQFLVCVLNYYYENESEIETINLVGGMSDTKDIINGKYSSKKCLKREFKEELGLDIENDKWNIELKYLKCPSESENPVTYHIGTIYEVKTSYTKEQLEKMFRKASHDNEIKELVFFSKENYKEIYNCEHKKTYLPELFEKIFN